MSFQGAMIGWLAVDRRHHAFIDRPGDPHSPYRYGASARGQLRSLAHAHIGWLLRDDRTACQIGPRPSGQPRDAGSLGAVSPPCAPYR